MNTQSSTYHHGLAGIIRHRAGVYFKLIKFKLTFLVVVSALFGYYMAPGIVAFDFIALLMLALAGFAITGASNTLNQVMEVQYDKMMKRTAQRPLPLQEITGTEAAIFAITIAGAGVLMLGFYFNLVAALLGIISLLLYAFVYTPMKRISRASVFVGAFPGAAPLLIGWAAATGSLGAGAWILFLFQFIWQFPHFWAIAWLLDEDYGRAGFKMLPSSSGKSTFSASIILLYTGVLVPICILPLALGITGYISTGVLLLGGVFMTVQAFKLLKQMDDKSAKRLMFGSFIYLPLIQVAFLMGKFL